MKGKILPLLLAGVALVAGMFWWMGMEAPGELPPGHIVVLSESLEEGAFRWSFHADDGEGKPLETVFYTEEWSPQDDGDVEVVVRLFDSPAEGRTALHREARENAATADFVLTCVCPEDLARRYPNASFRIRFGGRNMGEWRMDMKEPFAVALGNP